MGFQFYLQIFDINQEHTKEKHQSEGVKYCCYGTCNSDTRYRHRESMKDVFFIPFPKPITQRKPRHITSVNNE
jgi:hypothetical protein